jgi:hypothetical protein
MAPPRQDPLQVLLKSLVTSVEDLRRDVKQLRNDNASLAAEVECLKESSGARFHRFPKLPVELRNMIWTVALTAPQTHIVTKELISRSNVNTVMQSCREARLQGIRLQLPYFQRVDFDDDLIGAPLPVKHYMNLDLDTLWLAEADVGPPHLEVFSPECTTGPILPDFDLSAKRPPQHRLKRLALPFSKWKDPDEGKRTLQNPSAAVGSTDVLRGLNGIQELLIVVGNEATIAAAITQRDTVFKEPHRRPGAMLPESFGFTKDKPDDLDLEIGERAMWNSWDLMALRLEKILHHFKKRRAEVRKQEIAGESST